MSEKASGISKAFQLFMDAAPRHSGAWMMAVKELDAAGASRDEVISALATGLPAAGHGVTQALPPAILAYDSE